MVNTAALVAVALSIACNGASAARLLGTEKMATKQIMNITQTVDRAVAEAFSCRGQSCVVADTAGSTGRIPIMKAEGANDDDIKCIISYNPEVGELLKAYDNNPPLVPKQPLTGMSTFISGINGAWRPIVAQSGSTTRGTFSGTCTPNILIFAKGTMEPGAYGITMGPKFTAGLPSGWSTYPVEYDADIPGDYCLGLPGGMVAKDIINQAASKCPNSKLFVSGYSQGAMVIRNGLARATPAAKSKVKGVITFGDPFNGAPIVGYTGPIAIYCVDGDGVCEGNFELRPAHLSYPFDDTNTKAQKTLLDMARGLGDQSCCRPVDLPIPPSPDQWRQTIKANGGVVPLAGPGITPEQWAQALSTSNGGIPKGTANTPGRKVAATSSSSNSFGGFFGRAVFTEEI